MRVQFNDGQEILDSDLNDVMKVIEKTHLERLAYYLTNKGANGFFSDSFFVDWTSTTSVSVRAGFGIQTDSSQTGTETTKRGIWSSVAQVLPVATAHATLGRIDIVCIATARTTTATSSRNVKNASTKIVAAQTLNVQTDWSNAVQVVTGTAAGSPVAPAVPSGYIKIATLTVTAATGVINQAAIVDNRTIFSAVNSQNTVKPTSGPLDLQSNNVRCLANTAGGSFQVNLPDSAGNPDYACSFSNVGGGVLTIALKTVGNKLQGTTNGTYALGPNEQLTFASDGAGGYWNN